MNISEHALVRYLERSVGINLDYYRQCIRQKCIKFAEAGQTRAFASDGLFIIEGDTVVTMLGNGMRMKRKTTAERREQRKRAKARNALDNALSETSEAVEIVAE